ncbi:UDP-3-O-(3-hydroxymyristoyl)glucosamine N-acyltransferase [Hippea maritima]|uniref:UDP-3-O-acylglucosamine N-acyltransferase n=1 Tax=Hippea maritima (strain ATCC 700847 / DSM 10411 / MH2) TaxID=760142 RepID=F2LXD7_HIPMA|nr:UDP-3-O-(3-hydroxymyristoyl)glucosamine N-acyltransferase [Hippea maritima]AEA34251.1 UDP-3-O-(3-hydroxymyristoyl) glucosamine N-acyltransferase [Hippea maritima DSM 10411]
MKPEEVAKLLGCKAIVKREVKLNSVAPIETAKENELAFLSNPKYEKYLKTTQAGCIIVKPDIDIKEYPHLNFIICDNPYLAFAKIIRFVYAPKPPKPYIASQSYIDATAEIDKTARVEEFTYIGKNVKIGKHTRVMPFVYVGDNTTIGDNCLIYPHVTIREDTVIGDNVIIQAGAVIGSDGFGYATDENGNHLKIPQIGNVVIEDDVEIGSGTTIDRAALQSTVIKKGTKIDNLVQIAHNVEVGENSIIVAQTGISGSTKVGKNVILAGQTGIAGHLKIADNVIITAKSGIGKSISKPGAYSGIPAYEHSKWLKNSAVAPKLYEMYKKIKELEKRIKELEDANN